MGKDKPTPLTPVELLARTVVDSWDMGTLLSFAVEQMEIFYNDPENHDNFVGDLYDYGV